MNLILLGKPGAGKGSVSELLEKDGFIHLSTGDIFRREMNNETELGLLALSYISKGNLVPDDVTNKIVLKRIMESPNANYILDGYPRTVNQAEFLKEEFNKLGIRNTLALNISASDDVVIRRLSSRMVCRKCNTIYNKLNNNPKVSGICDKCGGEVYTRNDDKPDSIINRLSVYEEKTKPLIDYYKNENILYQFDGNLESNNLYKVIKEFLSEMNAHSSQNL